MVRQILLLVTATACSLLGAQSLPEILGKEIPVTALRLSYSHTASNGADMIWAYSYSDVANGRPRAINVQLIAGNRGNPRQKSGREWDLPYPDLVMQSIALGADGPDGVGVISIEANTPEGRAQVCKLFYAFTEDGRLRRELRDGGCLDK